ncbi:MAG: SulP family inorganic anion transporter [bacterium]|nr:SulP family inorganic anion transporter [bacterium]
MPSEEPGDASSPDRSIAAKAKAYARRAFSVDLFSGMTVGVVALPQSMAYALIAGAPPVFGLYTSIVSCVIGSLCGSSRHLITGPANATAIIFASTLAARGGPMDHIQALLLYTFLIGAIKFAFGALRLGSLTTYISDSVIVGFTAGAGILIAGNQIKHVLGLPSELGVGTSFLAGVWTALRAVGQTNPYSVAVAVGTIIVILAIQWWDRRIPGALIACIGAAVVVYFTGLEEAGVAVTGDIGAIPRGLPGVSLFPFDWPAMERMFSGAVAVAVIGLMEVTAVSKSIAVRSGQRLDLNREFMAQGLANMVGAFFSNFASSGSLTRSVLNHQTGARTRMAGVMSGIFVAVVVVTIGPLGEHIPIASLAGLLMLAAAQMVNRERLRLALRAGRESAVVLAVTIVATVTLRVDYAIYLGVLLALAFFVRQSSGARITLLLCELKGDSDAATNSSFREVPIDTVGRDDIEGRTVVINVIGAMYFGAMDDHLLRIRRVVELGPRAVVLRLRRVSNIDSSGLAALETMADDLRERRIPLTVCGVDRALMRTLRRAGLIDRIGSEQVIPSGDLVFNSIETSVQLAEALADNYAANDDFPR